MLFHSARLSAIATSSLSLSGATGGKHSTGMFSFRPFESLRMQLFQIKKHRFRDAFLFGPPEGIRTPDLQNRNLLRYPAAPRADFILPNEIYYV